MTEETYEEYCERMRVEFTNEIMEQMAKPLTDEGPEQGACIRYDS